MSSTEAKMKHEIVCIARQGYSILHTEGGDFAAKVTYLRFEPGQTYDPRQGVIQEWLVPQGSV
jgi:hypothetical protein